VTVPANSNARKSPAIAIERMFPVSIIQDRYFGLYSGGLWFAIAMSDAPWGPIDPEPSRAQFCLDEGPNGTDEEAQAFWRSKPNWIEAADTPDEALAKLRSYL